MVGITITVTGMDKIVAKYGQAAATAAVQHGLEAAAERTASGVKKRIAGKHHVTGFLLSSITASVAQKSGKIYARQGGGVYYAKFVEQGTGIYGPHATPIRPTHKTRLAWHPRSVTGKPLTGKGQIVRRTVKGQPGVGMFAKTLSEDKGAITAEFGKAFKASYAK